MPPDATPGLPEPGDTRTNGVRMSRLTTKFSVAVILGFTAGATASGCSPLLSLISF